MTWRFWMKRGGGNEASETHHVAEELHALHKAVAELASAIKSTTPHGKTPVAVSFTINPTGGKTVKILPDVKLFNTQSQPMDLNPVGPGATDPDETIHATVTSSAPDQVGVEVVNADTNEYSLTTPLDSGEATITISGNRKIEDCQFKVSYSAFVQGQWNPVLGEPVEDVPTP